MATKNGSNGKGKAPTTKSIDMIGGKNSLATKDGVNAATLKKVIAAKEVEKNKNWRERVKPKSKIPSTKISSASKPVPAKGISKLKVTMSTKGSASMQKTMKADKMRVTTKMVTNLKKSAPKVTPKPKAPAKKGPVKGR